MRKKTAIALIVGLAAAASMAETMTPLSVKGTATFQQDGNDWIITTATRRTVINWSGFNVARDATVCFQQPNAASSVLNRVLGPQASYIDGLLTSNGSVYLLNPNGVLIGSSGVIRVADFVASTLSLTDAEFLAGKDMNFQGTSLASIENHGKIEAIGGDIYLIASRVVNRGAVTASAGSANLLAAGDVLLTQDHKIFVRPSALTDGTGIGVDNSGVIEAVVARLQADGNMYALAINNTGAVRATGSEIADGRVLLQAEGGPVVSTGSLAAQTVKADGTTVGGSVVVWSDDATTVRGTISAEGAGGGAGGFVETSGYMLDIDGLELTCGSGGTWLIDPPYLEIDSIWAGAISSTLSGDTNVKVRNADSPGTTGIAVNADIVATPASGTTYLRLDANADIAINADIDVGVGRLYLSAPSGVTQAPGTRLAASKLWLGGQGGFHLNQPGNDFGTIAALIQGPGGMLMIRDVNDITIGTVKGLSGLSVLGGEAHVTTPNGHVLANGLFAPGVVTGYHALGNVAITETSAQTGSYEIRISNETPHSRPPAQVAPFTDLTPAQLAGLTTDINTMGSAVRIEFGNLAGDSLGYSWDFRTNEDYGPYPYSANDYCFVVVYPVGPGAAPQVVDDVEKARTSAMQDSGGFSWKTGWGTEGETLNGINAYRLTFGTMHVNHTEYVSQLYLRNIYFTGHPIPPGLFIFERIFDHVEDFPHVRPDPRVSSVGTALLAAALDEVSTYFDESAQGMFYDPSTQSVDPRYFYQSVGSIYQIPR